MSNAPSMYVLLALVPFVHLLDKMEAAQLEPLIADAIAENPNIAESPNQAIAQGVEFLVPLRDMLKGETVKELRRKVKEDFGISGHSKTKEDDLIQVLLTLDLEERQRLATLTEEEEEKTAGARKVIEDASNAEKERTAKAADAPLPPAPKVKARKKVEEIPKPYQISQIEVLVQFHQPTVVKKGKKKVGSAAPIAKSIYRGEMAKHVYKVAQQRDKVAPGFLKAHIKVLALEG